MEETREVVILNSLGLHARPAAKLSQEALKFKSEITINYKGTEINAKSILDILTLAVSKGEVLLLKARGEDAKEALDHLENLFRDRFGEEK